MEVRSIQNILACDKCGRLIHKDYAYVVQFHLGGANNPQRHYCSDHKPIYDQVTTTSGYTRYYYKGVELKLGGIMEASRD